ncbi:MAG: Hsp20/alpha crystallin family protein [Cyanobacteria bacterium REEB67]|nr:Hsp20/alpha crystallin family protein [Cyanobacteria bacterium REEB67]
MFLNRTANHNMTMRHTMTRNHFGFETMNNQNWNLGHVGYEVPCADVLELDNEFVLELALPGVVLDDIEIKVEGRYLTVIAKRTPTMFEEKALYIRRELAHNVMVREFEFETEILVDSIEARLDRGILFVSLPKVEAALRIPVSAGSIEGHVYGVTKNRAHKTEIRSSKEVTIK